SFFAANPPRRAKHSVGALPQGVDGQSRKPLRIHCKTLAHEIDQYAKRLEARFWPSLLEDSRGVFEHVAVPDQVGERNVIGPEVRKCRKVGVGKPPPPSLIHPKSMEKHTAQIALSIDKVCTLEVRFVEPFGPQIGPLAGESEHLLHRSRERSLVEAV